MLDLGFKTWDFTFPRRFLSLTVAIARLHQEMALLVMCAAQCSTHTDLSSTLLIRLQALQAHTRHCASP